MMEVRNIFWIIVWSLFTTRDVGMPRCHLGGGNESSELPGHHGSSSRVLGEAFAKRQGSAQDGPNVGDIMGYPWFPGFCSTHQKFF